MKKIVILIPSLSIGGGEKIAACHANDLSKKGYSVYLVLPKGNVKQKIDDNINVISGKSKNLVNDIFFCKSALENIKPDIVLSYMERANFINCILSVTKTNKWKSICSIHTVPSVAYKKRGILNRFFIHATMKIIKKLKIPTICVSNGVKKELYDNYKIENAILIPNYFEKTEFKSNINQLEKTNKVIFGFVGRLSKVKGCDIFLDALSICKKNNKNIDDEKEFWIIGDGSEKESLIKKAYENNIKIQFFGSTSMPEIYLKEIDYLVIPSYVEGFGLITLEGLYYGCSIIYSECKYGPKEIIESMDNQCIAYSFADPSMNKHEAIHQLSHWIARLKAKKTYSTKAKTTLLNTFSKAKSLDMMIQVIENCHNKNPTHKE